MHVVVSDTGPLHYLALIELIDVLPRLFTTVAVPESVRMEMDRPETPAPVRGWIANRPTWLDVRPAHGADNPSLRSLHQGERDAIALAVELRADLLLIDERAGIAAARSLGLHVTGTLGLLAVASDCGLVDLTAAFMRLKSTNFRYRQELIDALLAGHRGSQGVP